MSAPNPTMTEQLTDELLAAEAEIRVLREANMHLFWLADQGDYSEASGGGLAIRAGKQGRSMQESARLFLEEISDKIATISYRAEESLEQSQVSKQLAAADEMRETTYALTRAVECWQCASVPDRDGRTSMREACSAASDARVAYDALRKEPDRLTDEQLQKYAQWFSLHQSVDPINKALVSMSCEQIETRKQLVAIRKLLDNIGPNIRKLLDNIGPNSTPDRYTALIRWCAEYDAREIEWHRVQ